MNMFQRTGLEVYQHKFRSVIVLTKFLNVMDNFINSTFTETDWDILATGSLANLPDTERTAFMDKAVYLCVYKHDFKA